MSKVEILRDLNTPNTAKLALARDLCDSREVSP
jgi:hypothetical protein